MTRNFLRVYEELIADAAFRQAVDTVMPGVPFEVLVAENARV